jgi:hypothetical protein
MNTMMQRETRKMMLFFSAIHPQFFVNVGGLLGVTELVPVKELRRFLLPLKRIKEKKIRSHPRDIRQLDPIVFRCCDWCGTVWKGYIAEGDQIIRYALRSTSKIKITHVAVRCHQGREFDDALKSSGKKYILPDQEALSTSMNHFAPSDIGFTGIPIKKSA